LLYDESGHVKPVPVFTQRASVAVGACTQRKTSVVSLTLMMLRRASFTGKRLGVAAVAAPTIVIH
jgi:hypothetical protein